VDNIKLKDYVNIKIICPICKTEKILPIPKSPILEQKEALTVAFLQRGLICNHRFQALIDKNFFVKSYQIEDKDIIN
jgi:hypothetical protein